MDSLSTDPVPGGGKVNFNREILGIDFNSGITAVRVVMVLERIGAWRGYPAVIRSDNG